MLYFLSGLPRSGSTLLAAILNQHPDVHVTPTSGLIDLMGNVVNVWENNPTLHVQQTSDDEVIRLLKSVATAKYEHIEKPVVIDKSRGWPAPQIMKTMSRVLGEEPKIIATVRNVPDCAASFVRIAKPDDVGEFLRSNSLIGHLKESYLTLKTGYEHSPENFCIVDYDDLMDDPQTILDNIHKFLGLSDHTYDLNNIESGVVKEKDEEIWNIPGLHEVQPKLERQHAISSQDVLGPFYQGFCQPKFWLGEAEVARPPQPLDIQLALATNGEFELSLDIAKQIEIDEPDNHRAAYNRGWFALRDGDLQKGHELLDRGRLEDVFGNPRPSTPCPMWDGKSPGTVLLTLEGGLGDQIWGVRFAKDIANRGCRVVVACSGELAPLLESCAGISAIVQHDAVYGVYHDFWIPSFSAVRALGYEYSDIIGNRYIAAKPKIPSHRLKIGLRWQGNPRFEHEQHRVFPTELMFNAVKDIDADFISLQRDVATENRPDWVDEVSLNHWGETRDAISSCDLVISSCTSVAHLSGAMGVPTWIVSPVLPYFLWALPGEQTPWYKSVTLFRQTKFGQWEEPFNDIHNRLLNMNMGEKL